MNQTPDGGKLTGLHMMKFL